MSQAAEEKRRREATGRRGRQRSRGGADPGCGAERLTGRCTERFSERFLAGFDSVPSQYQHIPILCPNPVSDPMP